MTEHQQILRARRERLGLYTLSDVAAELGCTGPALYNHIKTGKIPAPRYRKGGKRLHYSAEDKEAIKAYWFAGTEKAMATAK